MPIRQIILDTETTGLSPEEGNRIVEIACLELIDGVFSGKKYQTYINAERDSHPLALAVHELTTEFLADKPKFSQIADDFLQFIEGAELIIHNAPFDLGFLNHELKLLGKSKLTNPIIDTRVIAQLLYSKEFLTSQLVANGLVTHEKLVQEQQAKSSDQKSLIAGLVENSKFRVHSLDHLCLYYGIDLSSREKNHGALVDCALLAQVYSYIKQAQAKQALHKEVEAVNESNSSIVNLSIFQPRKIPKESQGSELLADISMGK